MPGKNIQLLSDQKELRIYQCGIEKCLPDHAYGPAVRDHYLIHYIFEGCGIFQSEGLTYPLHAGQGFLICPDKVTFYKADSANPWHYAWIGFHGSKAAVLLSQAGLDVAHPVISCPSDLAAQKIDGYFEAMSETLSWKKGGDVRLMGLLHLFLAELIESGPYPVLSAERKSQSEQYISQAVELIQMNYSRKIRICSLARQIGLDRSYFGSLFRRSLGLTPQQYLLRLRMEKAGGLLSESPLPVAAVAHSVGYDDPLLFSRMFRQVKGLSPTDFRLRFSEPEN
jgi:AraC-like DNA-binding protein